MYESFGAFLYMAIIVGVIAWVIFNKKGTNYVPPKQQQTSELSNMYSGYSVKLDDSRAMPTYNSAAQAEQQNIYTTGYAASLQQQKYILPNQQPASESTDIYIGYGIHPEEYRAMMAQDSVAQAEQGNAYTTPQEKKTLSPQARKNAIRNLQTLYKAGVITAQEYTDQWRQLKNDAE